MRKFTLIILIVFLQQNLHSQNEIVGKVEFYKSDSISDRILQSSTDDQIEKLNSQEHIITIKQNRDTKEITTDHLGIFRIAILPTDTIFLDVNKQSRVLNSSFALDPSQITDTLKLRISDKNLVLYKDSIGAPEFYKKYNEQRAIDDFNNGSYRLLGLGGDINKEEKRKQKKLSTKYNLSFEFPLFGSYHKQSELRILHRYNKKMKELLGIENVW